MKHYQVNTKNIKQKSTFYKAETNIIKQKPTKLSTNQYYQAEAQIVKQNTILSNRNQQYQVETNVIKQTLLSIRNWILSIFQSFNLFLFKTTSNYFLVLMYLIAVTFFSLAFWNECILLYKPSLFLLSSERLHPNLSLLFCCCCCCWTKNKLHTWYMGRNNIILFTRFNMFSVKVVQSTVCHLHCLDFLIIKISCNLWQKKRFKKSLYASTLRTGCGFTIKQEKLYFAYIFFEYDSSMFITFSWKP